LGEECREIERFKQYGFLSIIPTAPTSSQTVNPKQIEASSIARIADEPETPIIKSET
jgi:hypothetical protein